MAEYSRRQSYGSIQTNQNPVLASKSTNGGNRFMEFPRRLSNVPEMSLEAKRAMSMAREDSKENINSRSPTDLMSDISMSDKIDDSKNNNENINDMKKTGSSNNNNEQTSISRVPSAKQNSNIFLQHRQGTFLSTKAGVRLPPVQGRLRPKGPTGQATARSRSTLSHNDPPYSLSDNNESYCNINSNASVFNHSTTNQASNGSIVNTDNVNTKTTDNDDDVEDDDVSRVDQHVTGSRVNEGSFVMALDKALQLKSINKLRGDITDTTQSMRPGTVRALNGGRLTNAQEVVVNVCHDDEKQLVFHDDDPESLDAAKTISHIRVNIWLDYNSAFHPDNNVHDHDLPGHDLHTLDLGYNSSPGSTFINTTRENTLPSISQKTPRSISNNSPRKMSAARIWDNNNNTERNSNSKNEKIGSVATKTNSSNKLFPKPGATQTTRLGSARSNRAISAVHNRSPALRK